MYEVVLKTEDGEEYKIYKDIVSMLLAAKSHGYAKITIDVKDGKLIYGSIELKSRWN